MPVARGADEFGTLYVWYENALGLMRRRRRIGAAKRSASIPDLSAVERYGSLHVRNRLIEAGLRRMRLRGAGTEFESLREWTDGDAFRAIDWKATARRGKTDGRAARGRAQPKRDAAARLRTADDAARSASSGSSTTR